MKIIYGNSFDKFLLSILYMDKTYIKKKKLES